MGSRAAKKSHKTISDDEGSDPLNIETCSSKSISDSDSSEDDEDDPEPEDQQTSKGIAPMTPPNTTAKK